LKRNRIIQEYQKRFGRVPRLFRAPGRVNLIGEHTDYQDGFVFPMAIDRYTTVAVAPREDRVVNVWSENMQEQVSFSLDHLHRRGHWSDYVAGVASLLMSAGKALPGADVYIESEIPIGAGLSSLAAIEIASALGFLSLVDGKMDSASLATLGRWCRPQIRGHPGR